MRLLYQLLMRGNFTPAPPPTPSFYLNGSNPVNATAVRPQGFGTITGSIPSFYLNGSNPVNATAVKSVGKGTITGGGSSIIVPDVAPYRTTGVAPLSVFFDATGTSAPVLSANPFHDFEYRWDFGDETVSAWQRGSGFGTSLKNFATGPLAMHSYNVAGTFTPALQVRFDTEIATLTLPSITVAAADAYWAGAKTVLIAFDGDFTGAPADWVKVSSTNAVTAVGDNMGAGDKRFLFKRGGTYASASRVMITQQGAGYVGAWGSGAKPIIDITTTNGGFQLSSGATPTLADWRFADLDIDGGDLTSSAFYGAGSCSDVNIQRCDMHNMKFGLSFSISTLDFLNTPTYTHPAWSKFYVADNTINDMVGAAGTANGSNGMYLGHERSAFMGNYINPNNKGEHGIRAAYESYCVFSHNEITGIPTGRAFLSLRSVDQGIATFPTSVYGTYVYSEKNYASDNYCYGGFTTGMAGSGPINGSSTGRNRDYIWERNLLVGSDTTTEYLGVVGINITARNNLFVMGAANGAAMGSSRLDVVPNPTNLWIYNNSVYSPSDAPKLFSVIANQPGDMTASVIYIKNNVMYAPNRTAESSLITNSVGATVVGESTNSTIAQALVSPNFTTTPPTAPADFKPTAGSYAIGAGVAVPVWADFYGTLTLNGTRDMGAILH